MVAPLLSLAVRHLGDLGLRVGPRLLGGVAHEGGDAQAELERRQVAVQAAVAGRKLGMYQRNSGSVLM
jgi:hypothetical protein